MTSNVIMSRFVKGVFDIRDLTKGSIVKLLLMFAVPLLFGNIFQLLYNLVDTRIVGTTLGENSLAALGATSSVNSMFIGFLNGITNGFSLIIARHFGERDMERLKKSVASTLVLGLATSAVLTVGSLVFMDKILNMLNTPQDIYRQAKAYIVIIVAGMTITMLYNVCAGILRAVGDTVTPLVFLIFSTIANVGLDFLFIKGFGFGVEGAAYATLIAQTISVVCCVVYILYKHRMLIPKKAHFRLEGSMVGDMMATGLSMGLMICLVNIGSLIMQSAINDFGTKIIVAHTAARKISEMLMMPISVFGMASATFASQNYGAGKLDRVKKGVYATIGISWVWSFVVWLTCFLFSPFLVRLVSGIEDTSIIETASKYMHINTPFYFVLGVLVVLRNALQGIGNKAVPISSSIIELITKIAVVLVLAPRLDYFGVMISEPIAWIGMAVLLSFGFFMNKDIRLMSYQLKQQS